MHRSLLSAVLSLSVLLGPLVIAQGASYTFTILDLPGPPTGINDRGQIVGQFFAENTSFGFVTDGATFTTIHVPGQAFTEAHGINNRGQIVGSFTDAAGTHGFVATPRQ